MIGEIRIYVEGGGDSSHSKARLRQGFGQFFGSLRDVARIKRIRWHIIATGPRNHCFDCFLNALQSHKDAFNVLLVDAEGPVSSQPRQHLHNRDGWSIQAPEDTCHLMAQTMEAWLVADLDALRRYYGQGFVESAMPTNQNVENIEKTTLESALNSATRGTQKGKYIKIRHAADLLKLIDPCVVCRKAEHCDRLFRTLTSVMEQTTS